MCLCDSLNVYLKISKVTNKHTVEHLIVQHKLMLPFPYTVVVLRSIECESVKCCVDMCIDERLLIQVSQCCSSQMLVRYRTVFLTLCLIIYLNMLLFCVMRQMKSCTSMLVTVMKSVYKTAQIYTHPGHSLSGDKTLIL